MQNKKDFAEISYFFDQKIYLRNSKPFPLSYRKTVEKFAFQNWKNFGKQIYSTKTSKNKNFYVSKIFLRPPGKEFVFAYYKFIIFSILKEYLLSLCHSTELKVLYAS
jgi:hypothetical protein